MDNGLNSNKEYLLGPHRKLMQKMAPLLNSEDAFIVCSKAFLRIVKVATELDTIAKELELKFPEELYESLSSTKNLGEVKDLKVIYLDCLSRNETEVKSNLSTLSHLDTMYENDFTYFSGQDFNEYKSILEKYIKEVEVSCEGLSNSDSNYYLSIIEELRSKFLSLSEEEYFDLSLINENCIKLSEKNQ